ncbi:MAG: GWxTD domain-containing protein [Calditrichaeota bacterium]|nr:GWxTD domain-containing protein [Calditrichota bacterium]
MNNYRQYVYFEKIMKVMLILVVFLTAIIPGAAFPQGKKFDFKTDFARFKTQGGDVYVEIYYSFLREGLTYRSTKDGFQAGCLLQTYIQKGGKAMRVDSLVITDFIQSLTEISATQKFTEQTNIRLNPGEYTLFSRLTDLVSKKSVVDSQSLKLAPFSAENLTMSDVQLASRITSQPKAENKFDKCGLRIMPNASLAYGTGFSKLFYYAEIYNLKFQPDKKESTFRTTYFIKDPNENIVKQVEGSVRQKPGSSAVIHGSFDLTGLISGFYTFYIEVIDDADGGKAVSKKNFSIYKPEDFIVKTAPKPIQKNQVSINEFKDMDEKSLDVYFEKIKYIALKDEKKIFKKLDRNGKINFLNEFWARRDPEPRTKINERKAQYLRLLHYAEQKFTIGQKAGWKTDRGRVLLVYGKPDEVERFPADNSHKAYQIWHYYNLLGGVNFYFVDFRQIGDYMLVHSTHPDEVQQEDWRDMYARLK